MTKLISRKSLKYLLLLGIVVLWAAPSLLTRAADQDTPQQQLLSQADEVLAEMSKITGLPIKGPLKKQVISRPEVEKYLTQNLHEEMTSEEIHAQEALVRALGLVPKDFSLEKFLVTFYTEQAAGFYDPKRKTMFIADWIPPEMQAMVLSHELTHALQDESWDLESYMHGARDNDDATSARQAVVEGYATAAMMQQSAGGIDLGQLPSLAPLMESVIHQQFGEFPAFTNAPYFFRLQALFPYVQGMGFIQAGLQHGGWKGLGVLFDHPPDATEEIYQPQVYFNHRASQPIVLERPPALEGASNLRFLAGNTLGELGYSSILGQLISEDEAKARGDSWAGDRYVLYENPNGDQYTLVARTRWTSPDEAAAFFHDYRTILTHQYPDLAADKRSTADEFIGSTSEGGVLLVHKADECLWAKGIPSDKVDTLLAWLRAL